MTPLTKSAVAILVLAVFMFGGFAYWSGSDDRALDFQSTDSRSSAGIAQRDIAPTNGPVRPNTNDERIDSIRASIPVESQTTAEFLDPELVGFSTSKNPTIEIGQLIDVDQVPVEVSQNPPRLLGEVLPVEQHTNRSTATPQSLGTFIPIDDNSSQTSDSKVISIGEPIAPPDRTP